MSEMFKVGDTITTNKKFDELYNNSIWWNKCKNTIMTIKSIRNGTKSISHGTTSTIMKVEENSYDWVLEWVVPYEFEFIKEDEFKV